MKCPKCGSEYHIGGTDVNGNLVCRACQLKEFGLLNNAQYPELYSTKTFNSVEPTTAEMLLWLAENGSIDIRHTTTEGIIYVWQNRNAVKFEGKTLTEAIIKAYEFARQEVTE